MMRFTLNKLYQLLIDISFLLTAFECYRIFFSVFDDFFQWMSVLLLLQKRVMRLDIQGSQGFFSVI